MAASGITHLIINSPFAEPSHHWYYERENQQFSLKEGRRPAGYVIASEKARSFSDPGHFIPIELVNEIRPLVRLWKENGYAGVTGITRRLLEHWNDPEQRDSSKQFFFCGLEAIETLIWLIEAPASERDKVTVPSDGGAFQRLCCKMATGSGKTVVMAMLVAWQVLNRVAYPRDERFSKDIFVVAPGLTVKSRLQVLLPSGPGNYYDEFAIVPVGSMREQLRQGRIIIRNWHALNWDTDEKLKRRRSVDKRGPRSDGAYVKQVLGEMATARNIIVINDEAHHAWRVNPESKIAKIDKAEIEEATKWVGGLDRIHRVRRILRCFDFSATPFSPSGRQTSEEALFGWIVSDFGLNDAVEAGLVKTPRIVVRTNALPDAVSYVDKLYHIYDHVRDDLNRKAEPQEPLPDLVTNAYLLLGTDWLEAQRSWHKLGYPTPPVMITVANRTETAARIKYSFDHRKILIDELCNPSLTLHIDSRVLESAEAMEESEGLEAPPSSTEDGSEEPTARKLTKDQQAQLLRLTVDTVGKVGQLGEKIQNVISVGMLSEGWDTKTVTHIMGLRAFTSQLLCEQVVGRGLRRTSYEAVDIEDQATGAIGKRFKPEYVNVFGVPFTFLPCEGAVNGHTPPPAPKIRIAPEPAKAPFEISWPNVIRVDRVYRPTLELNLAKVAPITFDSTENIENTEMAAVVSGKPNLAVMTEIDLRKLAERFRLQRITFEVARDVYDQMKPTWRGNKENLLGQVIRMVEKFIGSDKLQIAPASFGEDELKRRLMLTLNMRRIVQYVFEQIHFVNTETLEPVFDGDQPLRSTGDMPPWFTGRAVVRADRSHINLCVADSTWEAQAAYELDHNENVRAWVKNDHLGFEIAYISGGALHKYRPDYLVHLKEGATLVVEIKGQDTEKDRTKRYYMDEWVRAVTGHRGFGEWRADVCFAPGDLPNAIHRASTTAQPK